MIYKKVEEHNEKNVYFDEEAAIDYIILKDGGNK